MSLRICKIFLRFLQSCIVQYTKSSKLREFVWVVASPPWRRGPQVRAPWHHGGHGAVDVVGLVTPPGRESGRGTQECTQIGENGLSVPFWGIRVHCCTASCDTSRIGWHERPNRHGVPAAPPRWPPPLVGKTGPARAVPPLAWRLRRGSNPHKPPERHIFPEPRIRRGFGSIRG